MSDESMKLAINDELLKKYLQLCHQEQLSTTVSNSSTVGTAGVTHELGFIERIRIGFRSIWNHYFQPRGDDESNNSQFTELENLIIQDKSTFTSSLLTQYGKYVDIDIQENDSNATIRTENIFLAHIPPSSNKPTLIFIHGLGGTCQQFDLLFPKLIEESGYGLLCFDQPGFGLSHNDQKVPYDITLNRLTDLTFAVIEKVLMTSDDQEVHLVGHSYGTQIIINLICKYHQKLRLDITKIWLLTPPMTPKKPLPFLQWLFLKVCYYQVWIMDTFRCFDRVGNIKGKSLERLVSFSEGHDEEEQEYLKLKQFRCNLLTNSYNFINQILSWSSLTEEDLVQFATTIQLSVRQLSIIDGERDHLTHDSGSKLYAKLEPHFQNRDSSISYKLIKDAGHVLMIDHYKETLAEMLKEE
ncbi:hypothetical protein WICPIJ_007581 [Wickerhamomyces pijperi]|uniref:AB hydrolase-1 domain-containing protein n=1 Tax=Wickerhamomyces pijperi TaxID=599730 RepID=A0A9P8TJS6_WICPI|nr:hypothetical protein WICPIJ_007581 [Wickerhamomyces pijperi]